MQVMQDLNFSGRVLRHGHHVVVVQLDDVQREKILAAAGIQDLGVADWRQGKAGQYLSLAGSQLSLLKDGSVRLYGPIPVGIRVNDQIRVELREFAAKGSQPSGLSKPLQADRFMTVSVFSDDVTARRQEAVSEISDSAAVIAETMGLTHRQAMTVLALAKAGVDLETAIKVVKGQGGATSQITTAAEVVINKDNDDL